MIVGDAKRQVATPDGAPGQFWCAGNGGETGRSADGNWPVCAKTAELTFQLTFPDCWDGMHLDSPDHKSHVGGTGPDGTCASGKFPVAIPSLSFVIGYPTSGSTRRLPVVLRDGVVDARRLHERLGDQAARPSGSAIASPRKRSAIPSANSDNNDRPQ